ncbi:MAG: hypothetical protein RTU92_11190 [Candidatus Thorarchaeota archaeon]
MLNELTNISKANRNKREENPKLLEKMNAAELGQDPDYLLISPINRGAQDLDLLVVEQGDAFHATRVPGHPILVSELSPFLFGGPAAYYSYFDHRRGVVATFEQDDPLDLITESIDNIAKHPSLTGLPIIGLRVDYDRARASLVVHNKGRSYANENLLLSRLAMPQEIDPNTLEIICSDSRLRPPTTPSGLPVSIQTLGGYLPPYSVEQMGETYQLDSFFTDWLTDEPFNKQIVIVAHGSFVGEGASCGAATELLSPDTHPDNTLNMVLQSMRANISPYESSPLKHVEDSARSIAEATKRNLTTYPAFVGAITLGADFDDLVKVVLMDTVTNEIILPNEEAIE